MNDFMRKRDLAILLLSCLAVIFSFQQEERFNFKQVWFHPIDAHSSYQNGHFPLDFEKLPTPLITDIDGDGNKEIVITTSDYRIKIFDLSLSSRHSQQPLLKYDASLLPTVKVTTGRRPVALTSGYLTRSSSNSTQHQVIIVVTDGWTVLCYSHTLKLLWESNPQDETIEGMQFSEVTAVITSQAINVGDRGSVFVGGRLVPISETETDHEHGEEGAASQIESEKESESIADDEAFHFSYYGFDGKTGALRWRHEEGDFYAEASQSDNKDFMPEHSYKLHVLSSVKHLGEVDWRYFKEDVLAALPHQWNVREDTSFIPARFQKRRQAGGLSAKNDSWNSEDIGIPSRSFSLNPFYSTQENKRPLVEKPNVIVANLRTGIEVIHLFTGRTLCRLKLRDGLFADINGDGIVDQVQATARIDEEDHTTGDQHSVCYALATAGVPHIERLFNGSICKVFLASPLASVGALFADEEKNYKNGKPIHAANVLTLESSRSSSLLSFRSRSELDSIFLVSTGRMTSFRPSGKINWQVDTAATWMRPRKSPFTKTDEFLSSQEALLPSLISFPLETNGGGESILAVASSMVVLSPFGSILATAELSDVPVNKPAIGDFNNDGFNDVVLVTPNGFYGYILFTSYGTSLLSMLLLAIIVAVGLLFFYSTLQTNDKKKTTKRAMD